MSYAKTQVEIDEDLLINIAKITDGQYFRATDNQKLQDIYREINKLEKSDIEELKYYNYDEKYRIFILSALLLLSIELVLKYSLFRSFI